MNYRALIQGRRTCRIFSNEIVPSWLLQSLKDYYNSSVTRIIPELKTHLLFYDSKVQSTLLKACGYEQFSLGSPEYMILLSEYDDLAHLNAGYIMEDLILKLLDMGLDSCWLSFANSFEIKRALRIRSSLCVAAIVAFGYGKPSIKRPYLNISISPDCDLSAKRQYMEHGCRIDSLAFMNTWNNTYYLDQYIGFYDDIIWECLYAASLAPSYLNRRAYKFLFHEGGISLISKPDFYTSSISGDLSLGTVLHHFSVVAESMGIIPYWRFNENADKLNLPRNHILIATSEL